ncbi:alpha/beta hydrolase [Ningiella sp. W23]|uniref:alpha/beta hydrolase n=1 Tax=Ningiella sp. W23 TaxID=3023715 RepID=UPI003756CB59
MYVVTNREIFTDREGLEQFGERPNAKGPNELRVLKVERNRGKYKIELLEDELPESRAKALIKEHALNLDPEAQHWISLEVAVHVTQQARKKKTHVLFFVHGFNNDAGDVIERAFYLQDKYGVEVIPFTWPANGGGAAGAASYKSDKRDARASTGALERILKTMREHFVVINEGQQLKLLAQANEKHPKNKEARDCLYSRLIEKECPFTFNAMFHSMGNYLLKQMLKSSTNEGNDLTFDNVVLVAADTNNADHKTWVDTIRFRKRLFITINEEDIALKLSRAKFGSNQLARLGHYIRALDAENAHYINFTSANWVKRSHAYFEEPAEKNEKVKAFFQEAFTGKSAELSLKYRAEGNWYEV